MSKIKIFNSKKELDLERFIDSRGLICANSGAGKSYTARKILEESNEHVMAIILDIEGEFKTLREKFPDFLLIGQDGDVELNMESASLLPKKLLELNASAILDISELKQPDRIRYTKKFLEALMEVERKYWKPCLILLDEIHRLAGQQEKQDSTYAVIDLATRGRKRGFCLIGATQRISKLHKDVVAELNNYFIGRTSLDIDMKRSADILGFSTKQDMLSLRDLNDGEFYVFGPAISKTVEKEQVALTKTTHPKRGMLLEQQISPPTEKIKNMLSKLSDLPKEAQLELKTLQEHKKEINRLKFELRKKPQPETRVDERASQRTYDKGFKHAEEQYYDTLRDIKQINKFLVRKIEDASKTLDKDIPQTVEPKKISSNSLLPNLLQIRTPEQPATKVVNVDFDGGKITGGAMRILKASAMFHPNPISKARAGAIAGLSFKSGSFNTYISTLRRNNLIDGNGREFTITEQGMQLAGDVQPLPDNLVQMWANIMKGGASRMLIYLSEQYPNSISKDELGEGTSMSHTSGTFNTYLSTLKRNGLIKIDGQEIKCSAELFE